jgi:predicted nuclease of restriction endonuclease-like (RecB) superfamily
MKDKHTMNSSETSVESLSQARLYESIRTLLLASRTQVWQTVNTAMVQTYWHVGRMIVEDEQGGQKRAAYGKKVLPELARKLSDEFGAGFDVSNLRNMRQFFQCFPIRDALRLELSWTHYRSLIRIENPQAREWYAQEAAQNIRKEATPDPRDFIRDPYVLEFLGAAAVPALYEKDLEQGLLDQLQTFLLELGKGFAFVARQKHLRVEGEDCFIDLVFYNYLLKCFVLVDLKVGKLAHQDVGQMDMYVRVFDEQHRQESDNPTLGLILCSERNAAVAKYSQLADKAQLFASKYQALMPTEAELQAELERDRALLEIHKAQA